MDIDDMMKNANVTIKDAFKATCSYIKSHLILGLIVQAILLIGLAIINYKIVHFGNFVGIYFISLGIAIVDLLPVFGMLMPMAIWAVCAMTFGDNMKLGISVLVLCFVAMIIKQIVEPFVVGKVMGISAVEEILSSVAGYILFGFSAIGFLVGPIVYTIIKVIYMKKKNKPMIVEKCGYKIPSKSKSEAKDITNEINDKGD